MGSLTDRIELILPIKAEYVSVVRLAVSGIANRVGFDIETIEDIKVAVAEVCNKLVGKGSTTVDVFSIIFEVSVDKLAIVFDCADKSLKCIFDEEEDELGLSIINAFMDSVEFCPNGSYILSMTKAIEG